jgi:hypothetical protein
LDPAIGYLPPSVTESLRPLTAPICAQAC